MKKVKLVVYEPSINNVIGNELNLLLNDEANVIDALIEADKIINDKGEFSVPDYRSLLHMVYNPVTDRFYNQVAVAGSDQSGHILNVRENPRKRLPEVANIIIIPTGGCISEWEEAIDYEQFLKAMSG
jgi:hypothetical protein